MFPGLIFIPPTKNAYTHGSFSPGNDVVNVFSTLPTPTIAVNGDADGDMLRMNAESGVFDPMVVNATSSGAGLVWYFNGNAANVAYTGIEQIDLLGQLADGDAFGVDGTAGNDQLSYQQGAAPDQGTVTGTMNQNGVPFPLPTVTFSGMAQASLLRFNNFSGIGGSDQFVSR